MHTTNTGRVKLLYYFIHRQHLRKVSYVNGMFIGTKARPERHICGIARVSVLDKSGNLLNKNIGRTIIKQIEAFEINSSLQPQY
ncbi:MAG: hypothetical protein IPG87_17630 [Saprospiraceae bacterium]|nr:hypothetical protein [Candidatus Vicinibacter affinis]